MIWTDDPERDFAEWDAEQQEKLDKLPICSECEEHIQQEDAVCIHGEWFCDDCLNDMRKDVHDEW